MRAVAPHAGVWGKCGQSRLVLTFWKARGRLRFKLFLLFSVSENPPSGKQMVSKMLVIKKVSKEDPSTAFSAGFAIAGALPTNGSKAPITGSSVYKNLVPKPATAPIKVRLPAVFVFPVDRLTPTNSRPYYVLKFCNNLP